MEAVPSRFPFRFGRRGWRPARRPPPYLPTDWPSSTHLGVGVSATQKTTRLGSLLAGAAGWSIRLQPPALALRSPPPFSVSSPTRWGRLRSGRRRRPRPFAFGLLRLLPNRRRRLGRFLLPLLIARFAWLPPAMRIALALWIRRRRGRRWSAPLKRLYALPFRTPTLRPAAGVIPLSTSPAIYSGVRLHRFRLGLRTRLVQGVGRSPFAPRRLLLCRRRSRRPFSKRRRPHPRYRNASTR